MIQTISFYEFEQAFKIRPDNFSYEGLRALFNYFEEMEEVTGSQIELDPIAICSKYTEYISLAGFQVEHSGAYSSIADIKQETTVIKINELAFIIQQF